MPPVRTLALLSFLFFLFGETWNPIDLTLLRQREPVVSPAPARPAGLPVGEVEQQGVPLRFGRANEAWDLPARGQRIALAPVEGGRFYEVVLACGWSGEKAERLALVAIGAGTETRECPLACAPAENGAAFALVRVPVAAPWPIDSVRLPKDERLHVFAISARWVTEGPGNEAFRRAFLGNELAEPGLQRYLANLGPGAALGDAEVEGPFERALFDNLLCGRVAGARRIVELRLKKVDEQALAARKEHLHACLVVPPRGGAERLEALRALVALLDADAELAGAVGGLELVRALERKAPAEFERFAALVAAGRIEIAGFEERLDWSSSPSERALRASFEGGADWVAAHGFEKLARPGILGDPALQPLLPGWCGSRGYARAVQWSEGPCTEEVPAAFGWRSPARAALLVVHVPPPTEDLGAAALAAALERSHVRYGTAELFLTLEVDAGGGAVRAKIAALRAFAARELGPTLRFDTPDSAFEELRAGGHFRPAYWDARPSIDLGAGPVAPLALRSANRRAEAELECASRAGAFAQLDGLLFLEGAQAELSATLASNLRDDGAAAIASSRAVAESARARALESIGVLARSARTAGEGEALLVFNPLPYERTETVELTGTNAGVLDADGRALAVQRTLEGRTIFLARVPALGHAVFHQLAQPATAAPATPAGTHEEGLYENGRIALRIDAARGALASLRLLPDGPELLGEKGATLAWLPEAGGALALPETAPVFDLVEDGPVRLVLRRSLEIAGGHVSEDLILERDRPEVLVRCRAEGLQQRGTLLACFDLRAAAQSLVFDSGGAYATLDPARRDALALVPLRRFAAAQTAESGLALESADGARFGCAPGTLVLEIAQGGELGGGESEYALRPFAPGTTACTLRCAADELLAPLFAVSAEGHGGLRAARHTYLELARRGPDGAVANGPIELVALRPSSNGCELELREQAGASAELSLQPARGLFAAEEIDARSGSGRALDCERGALRTPIEPWSARRIRLRLRP